MSGTVHHETSLTVTWTPPPLADDLGQSLQYQVTLNNSDTSGWISETSYQFTGLTPGTVYTFNVTSRTVRNPGFSETQYTSVTAHSGDVFTKPAQPGQLTDNTLPSLNDTVIVKFTRSEGNVDSYTVSVSRADGGGGPISPQSVSSEGGVVSAVFVGLVPGVYYTVSITAVSNSIDNDVTTDRFRAQVQPTGIVKSLSLEMKGSRWSQLTWQKPDDPNGNITGYVAKLMNEMGCFSGVAVKCSDCTYNSTEMTPDVGDCVYTREENLTLDQMDDDTLSVKINVTDLKPDVLYNIMVVAYNEDGDGEEDTHLNFTTLSEAAANLKTVQVSNTTEGQLQVAWTPGERRGQTTYLVTWMEQQSLTSPDFVPTDSHVLQGYNNNSYTIPGLLSYWNYEITVSTYTNIGLSPDNFTTVYRTKESKPGQIQDLKLEQPDDVATDVRMTFDCPPEKERNGKLVSFYYNATITSTQAEGPSQQAERPEGSVTITGDQCSFSRDLNVTAETDYSIRVVAVTDTGLQGEPRTITIKVMARPPKTLQTPTEELVTSETSSETMMTVTIATTIFSARQGKLLITGLLVCRVTGEDSCSRGRSKRSIHRVRRDAGTVEFSIGDNSSCSGLPDNVYCNGPLTAGQEYKVYAFSCTGGGCSETTEPIVLKTKAENPAPVGAIIGGVVATVVVIGVIVVVVVWFKRRKSAASQSQRTGQTDQRMKNITPKHTSGDQQPSNHRPYRLPHNRGLSTQMTNRDYRYDESLLNQQSVSMVAFSARLGLLHRNSNLHFKQEYQELMRQISKNQYSADIGKMTVNRIKNRNPQVLPYDHTRVKLFTREHAVHDYINASYIAGPQSPCDYIATQTPLVSTVPDFWKMVWEQRCCVIVMMNSHSQRTTNDDYWPSEHNSPAHYGDVTVTMLTTQMTSRFTVRHFNIQMHNQKKRQVHHYQLSGWLQEGTSLTLHDYTDDVSAVGERMISGPVVVHCSEGTALTCTFMAVHMLHRYIQHHDLGREIDVFSTVTNIAKCRPASMQSLKQYMFIHEVVGVMVERKMMGEEGRRATYENTHHGHGSSSVYDSTYEYVEDGNHYDTLEDARRKMTSL